MLFRKLVRELFQNATQFVAIFLMSFLGICIFFGFDTEATTLEGAGNAYYEEYKLPDYWIDGKSFTTADCQLVQDIAGVEAVERRTTVQGTAKIEGDPTMTLSYLEDNKMSQMRIVEGEPFDVNVSGIWLDNLFAKEQGLEIGNILTIKIDDSETTEEIRGIINISIIKRCRKSH